MSSIGNVFLVWSCSLECSPRAMSQVFYQSFLLHVNETRVHRLEILQLGCFAWPIDFSPQWARLS